jgi:hypothetical protein
MVVFGFLFLALIVASIVYFTASPSTAARKYAVAFIAGLAFSSVAIVPVSAETIEVVASDNGCTTTYSQAYAADGSAVSAVTLSCPRLPIQIAAIDQS